MFILLRKWKYRFRFCDLDCTQESFRDMRANAVRAVRVSSVVSSLLQALQQPLGAVRKQLLLKFVLFFSACLIEILTEKHYTCMKDNQEIQFPPD